MARWFAFLLAALMPLAPVAVRAAPADIAVTTIEQWLLPRYEALGQATALQREAWARFCKEPTSADVETLRRDFHAVADAWAAVEFVTLGPVTLALRADRFNLFPDRRNAVARALADHLKSADAERLSPEQFGRTSVAGQGLPALERILFEGDVAMLLSPQDSAFGRRCATGAAIAANLDTIAHDIRREWGSRSEGVLGKLARGESDDVFFPEPNAALSVMLTDLAGLFQRAVDQKILPVMGANADEAKPLLAEGRRSGRSARNLKVAVASGAALAVLLAGSAEAGPRATVEQAFAAAQRAAEALPADLGAAASDPSGRAPIDAAVVTFKAAQRTVANPLAPALGSSLGFNALDGD